MQESIPRQALIHEIRLEQSNAESIESLKNKLVMELPEHIRNQRVNPDYQRPKIEHLYENFHPIKINSVSIPLGIEYSAQKATFYGYNSEGVRDLGWGCAWRAIQTLLSSYGISITFENLFHLFGRSEVLKLLYEDKYPDKKLSGLKKFAPYDLESGWAEPFIGEMVMYFYNLPAVLEAVNGIPSNCNAPQDVFHHKPLNFHTFNERLKQYFKGNNAFPIMIDDGSVTMNIIGIGVEGSNTVLWIADPHILESAYLSFKSDGGLNKMSHPGLYQITLDDSGKQIHSSLNDKDKSQLPHLFCIESSQGFHFDNKKWMVLFPL